MPVPKSFIKNISLQLKSEYVFDNSPHEESSKLFIGRKEQLRKFLEFLKSSTRGVFLVTGYRGMGKTSFVNRVLEDYKKMHTDSPPIYIRLTIAQSNPNELSVLKQIVSSIYDQFRLTDDFRKREKRIEDTKSVVKIWKLILSVSVILAIIFAPVAIFPAEVNIYLQRLNTLVTNTFDFLYWGSYISVFATLVSVITLYWLKYSSEKRSYKQDNDRLYKMLQDLADRTFANVSEENQNSKFLNIDFKGIKASSEDSLPKKGKSYPLATAKEIEYQLTQFLAESRKSMQFIFVFDELDKVELLNGYTNIYQGLDSFELNKNDSNVQNLLRNKKQAVMNVISSLKNFFTTASARFIFIAGREMFDASLADVSDKQSPLSSVFTYSFNIESLLKEESAYANEKNTSSLTNAIEEFLKYQLSSQDEIENDRGLGAGLIVFPKGSGNVFKLSEISFSNYFRSKYEPDRPADSDQLSSNHEFYNEQLKQYSKLFYLFQTFITYLAYRSNGSPKKLIKAFHEFVLVKEDRFNVNKVTLFAQPDDKQSPFYLYFNYYNQYRLGFINYLYRPFLIQNGRSFKLYSDNAIIAVPYLFDHLIKFHPFAFSRSNLELVPELLSTNKTPSIKQDLDNIMSHLGNNHIRDTDIELFEYKFYSKSYNEIVFISRIFEEEAAAFNFTLDENFSVKLLLNDKIKELRSIFSKFHKESGGVTQQIFSIAFHNGNLGDLHFFDQEYDDAIGNYSDAIRPINNNDVKMNIRDFVTLTRNKLKIGLCFEKINSYEEALTFYSDSAQDIKKYMSYHINKGSFLDLKNKDDVTSGLDPQVETFYSSSFNDLLQITVQSFLAKIYVQEKMGLEGITTSKVKVALGEFFKIAGALAEWSGRNHIIVANSCLQLGKLLYFKNSPFPTLSAGNPFEYPKWIEKRLQTILTKMPQTINDSKRQPILSFAMYLLALDELLISRNISGLTPASVDEVSLLCGKDKVDLTFYFKYLNDYLTGDYENYTLNHYKYIAGIMSSLGDCILGMHDLHFLNLNDEQLAGNPVKITKDNYNNLNLKDLLDFSKMGTAENFSECFHVNNTDKWYITDVIRCYHLAARYYKKFGRMASASFQYRKLLQLFKVIVTPEGLTPAQIKEFISFVKEHLIKKALEITSQNSNRSDSHMVNKAKHMDVYAGNIWNNISNHPDTKEILLFFEYIKLKLGVSPQNISDFVDPHNSFATQHSRLMELDYYSKFLSIEIKKSLNKTPLSDGQSIVEGATERQFIIDYLFSMNTILRILKIYGTDYMLGYSYTAYTHYRIAAFIETMNKCRPGLVKGIVAELEELFSGDSMVIIDGSYHFSMANDLYHMAIQLHTAGSAYKKTVKDMIYLEDDFNDNAYHFGAALDRYMMAAGVFAIKTKNCKKRSSLVNEMFPTKETGASH